MLSYPARVGETVAEKYVIERVIGKGGMGVVVAARHVELDQRVAIKFLLPQIAEHATTAKRFRREARAAARLRGDHTCRVLDVASLDNGIPYMVMEYLEGCDLATELARRKRLPPVEAVDYVLQACDALAEAHASGIIHRDLKPSNLFLAVKSDCSRSLKVLDFGVSKFLSDSDAGQMGLTDAASFIGSPLYMSPEQLVSSKDVDSRTDIWALGAVLYELIAGRTPFLADCVPQLADLLTRTQPPALSTLGVKSPEGLEQVILQALAKQREDRYGSVLDFARALAPYAPSRSSLSVTRIARLLRGLLSTPAPVPDPTAAATSTPIPLDDRAQEISLATAELSAADADPHADADPRGSSGGDAPHAPTRRRAQSRWSVAAVVLIPALLLAGISYRLRSTDGREPPQLDSTPAAPRILEPQHPRSAGTPPPGSSIAAPTEFANEQPPDPLLKAATSATSPTTMQAVPPKIESKPPLESATASATDSPRRQAPALPPRERSRLPGAFTPQASEQATSSRPHVTDFGGRR